MDQMSTLASDSQAPSPLADLVSDRSQALLQSALDALPLGIAIVDAQGFTVAVNATCQRYVLEAQGRSWLPGMPFADSLDSCRVPEVSEALRSLLRRPWLSGETQSFPNAPMRWRSPARPASSSCGWGACALDKNLCW